MRLTTVSRRSLRSQTRRAGMGRRPSSSAIVATAPARRDAAARVELDDRHALDEVARRQTLTEARRTAGRQHVVGAGGVVAEGRRGARSDEDRAGVAHPRHERGGVGHVQLEMLGSEGVHQLEGRRRVAAGHDGDAVGAADRARRRAGRPRLRRGRPALRRRRAAPPWRRRRARLGRAGRPPASRRGPAASATISTSLGPARPSMRTSPITWRLASVT